LRARRRLVRLRPDHARAVAEADRLGRQDRWRRDAQARDRQVLRHRRHVGLVHAALGAAVIAAERDDLAALWRTLRTVRPGVRTREAAVELGVSEAELVATSLGDIAVRLDHHAGDLLHALTEVGRCFALTRNEHAVSEVRGRYGGIELGAHAGQVIG